MQDRRPGWSNAKVLDAVIARHLAAISRRYQMNMFQSAARDAIRSECERWQAQRREPKATGKSRCVEAARTIAARCNSLLINLGRRD